MAERRLVCVPFNYDESWIGGVYYVKNLIAAMNCLPPPRQPDIFVLSNKRSSFEFLREESEYSRMRWIASADLAGVDRRILSRRRRLESFLLAPFARGPRMFDLIFPYPVSRDWLRTACWIPDFQDKRLPHFFSADELAQRESQHRDYFTNYRHVVFSSNSARSDFHEFYPEADVSTHVIHFAVSEKSDMSPSRDEIRRKYNLPERYFYAPNQFWIHKNHRVVIEAAALLKERGIDATIVFSGKEHDHRAPNYLRELKALAVERGVCDRIRFLGFLPRIDQMSIFRDAICIIQPSLFEGWSTVIEDAKSVGKFVLASNLDVNKEQAVVNAEFFDPADADALAALIGKYVCADPEMAPFEYDDARRAFAEAFMRLVDCVSGEPPARAS